MDPKVEDTRKKDAFLRELERKSLDTLMVYNPTDQDYFVEWDRRFHRIPAKNKNAGFGNGRMELVRYLAEKYAREMKNKLITEDNDQRLDSIKERMRKAGIQDVVLNANIEFERLHELRTDYDTLIKKYYDILILGVVREYGMDMPMTGDIKQIDVTKTPEELVLENLSKHYIDGEIIETESVPSPPPKVVKEKASLEEVTA